SVAVITKPKRSASWLKVAMIDGVIAAETIAPMTACAPIYDRRGTLKGTPPTPNTIAAIIGPSINPAGSPAVPQMREIRAESVSSAAHRAGAGHVLPNPRSVGEALTLRSHAGGTRQSRCRIHCYGSLESDEPRVQHRRHADLLIISRGRRRTGGCKG